MSNRKIIVLTPVRNEAWILDRFLTVCSLFADHIIIADQNSSDGSLEIYSKYHKVYLINNNNANFNEADRQTLLLNAAREKFGIGNILLAIDADEILSANAMQSLEWSSMLNAKVGSILFFEKPTFLKNTSTVIRYNGKGWPLGYIDDGAIHKPTQIHSTRIPTPEYAENIYFSEIKFLHYALVRLDAQASKERMYSMLENIKKTKSLRLRLRHYNSQNDRSSEGDAHNKSDPSWFYNWDNLGIDMHTITSSNYYWYDFECLKLFNNYGINRFMLDDIWNFDWEKCRIHSLGMKYEHNPSFKIKNKFIFITNFIISQIRSFDDMALGFKKLFKGGAR